MITILTGWKETIRADSNRFKLHFVLISFNVVNITWLWIIHFRNSIKYCSVLLKPLIFVSKMFLSIYICFDKKLIFMLFKTEHFGHNSYGYNRTHSRSWLTPILFLKFWIHDLYQPHSKFTTWHIRNHCVGRYRTKEQINKTDFP